MSAALDLIQQVINGQTISIVIFFIGVYGMIARRNIIKSVFSYAIMQAGIVTFFISINATHLSTAPVGHHFSVSAADPLPQALMITNIIIGTSLSAVAMTMFITLYHRYGSTNWNKVRQKRKEDL